MRSHLRLIPFGLAFALTGCASIGPGQVASDRYDYSSAIGESWKSQTLLNIVKLRYVDPPIFVDVGQIVASRSLQQQYNVNGSVSSLGNSGIVGAGVGLSAQGTYTDTPTVTFTPLTGDKYIRSLMTPLLPESVVFMVQSGWPADAVLVSTAGAINGLKNQQTTVDGTTPPEPNFLRVLALLRKIQVAGGIALSVREDEQKHVAALLTIRREDISPETLADSLELRRLLRVDPGATEFKLVFGATAVNGQQIALLTRSILQLMATLAALVDVPAKDLAEHRVPPGWQGAPGADEVTRLLVIHCSDEFPTDAFASVRYRGHWFYIDDRDLKSKRAFTLMLGLFTLADTGDKPPPAQLVIPTR